MKDINEKLGTEKLSANLFGIEGVPEQSQINKVLNRMDENSIAQIDDIHHKLFLENSNSVYDEENVVVEYDQSGLIANGRLYEYA